MNVLDSILGNTPEQQLVGRATDDVLLGPDWALNLEVVDAVNSGDKEVHKEVVKGLKRRLTHKEPKVQTLALTLIEALMKNCNEPLHEQVASKDFQSELAKLVQSKNVDTEVRDKLLQLISTWAVTFAQHPRLKGFHETYAQLAAQGVAFPPGVTDNGQQEGGEQVQSTNFVGEGVSAPSGSDGGASAVMGSPVHCPGPGLMPVDEVPLPVILQEARGPSEGPARRRPEAAQLDGDQGEQVTADEFEALQAALAASLADAPAQGADGASAAQHGEAAIAGAEAENMSNDVTALESNLQLFEEVLGECASPEEAAENDVLGELLEGLRASQPRVLSNIEAGEMDDESALARLLQVHEMLASSIDRYEKFMATGERVPTTAEPVGVPAASSPACEQPNAKEKAVSASLASNSSPDPFPGAPVSTACGSHSVYEVSQTGSSPPAANIMDMMGEVLDASPPLDAALPHHSPLVGMPPPPSAPPPSPPSAPAASEPAGAGPPSAGWTANPSAGPAEPASTTATCLQSAPPAGVPSMCQPTTSMTAASMSAATPATLMLPTSMRGTSTQADSQSTACPPVKSPSLPPRAAPPPPPTTTPSAAFQQSMPTWPAPSFPSASIPAASMPPPAMPPPAMPPPAMPPPAMPPPSMPPPSMPPPSMPPSSMPPSSMPPPSMPPPSMPPPSKPAPSMPPTSTPAASLPPPTPPQPTPQPTPQPQMLAPSVASTDGTMISFGIAVDAS